MAALARQENYKRIFVPEADAGEAALIPDLEVIPVPSLSELYAHLIGQCDLPTQPHITPEQITVSVQTDFRDIKGQEHVKRALEVAAAGGHNVLMIGPPGAGKTTLLRSVAGLMRNAAAQIAAFQLGLQEAIATLSGGPMPTRPEPGASGASGSTASASAT